MAKHDHYPTLGRRPVVAPAQVVSRGVDPRHICRSALERAKVFESHLALLLGLPYTQGNWLT